VVDQLVLRANKGLKANKAQQVGAVVPDQMDLKVIKAKKVKRGLKVLRDQQVQLQAQKGIKGKKARQDLKDLRGQ
jgi:hypothetical protein